MSEAKATPVAAGSPQGSRDGQGEYWVIRARLRNLELYWHGDHLFGGAADAILFETREMAEAELAKWPKLLRSEYEAALLPAVAP